MDQDNNNNPMDLGAHATNAIGDSSYDDNLREMENLFSSMRTTDKDTLVKQLGEIVGNKIDKYTANFFLDMSNWNLHRAVGLYFDHFPTPGTPQPAPQTNDASSSPEAGNGKFSTTFSCASFPSPTVNIRLSPKVPQKVTIGLQNDGNTRWPEGCSLRYVQGDQNLAVWPRTDDLANVHNPHWTVTRIPVGGSPMPMPSRSYIPLELTLLYPFIPPNPTESVIVIMQWSMFTPDGYTFGKPINFQVEIKATQQGEPE